MSVVAGVLMSVPETGSYYASYRREGQKFDISVCPDNGSTFDVLTAEEMYIADVNNVNCQPTPSDSETFIQTRPWSQSAYFGDSRAFGYSEEFIPSTPYNGSVRFKATNLITESSPILGSLVIAPSMFMKHSKEFGGSAGFTYTPFFSESDRIDLTICLEDSLNFRLSSEFAASFISPLPFTHNSSNSDSSVFITSLHDSSTSMDAPESFHSSSSALNELAVDSSSSTDLSESSSRLEPYNSVSSSTFEGSDVSKASPDLPRYLSSQISSHGISDQEENAESDSVTESGTSYLAELKTAEQTVGSIPSSSPLVEESSTESSENERGPGAGESSPALAIGLGVTFGILGAIAIAGAVFWILRPKAEQKEEEGSEDPEPDQFSGTDI
jgi:hypothetical protein